MEMETKEIAAESPSAPSFDEFLQSKKIDSKAYKKSEDIQYRELKTLFDQVHPNSFVQQKLFLINGIRRNYQLVEQEVKPAATPVKKVKPKMSIKPKLK